MIDKVDGPLEVRSGIHFWNHDGVEGGRIRLRASTRCAWRTIRLLAYQFCNVIGFEASSDGVDTDGALLDTGWTRLIEKATDVGPSFSFPTRSDRVFEIINYAVGGEASSFIEHLLRRTRDIEQGSPDSCSRSGHLILLTVLERQPASATKSKQYHTTLLGAVHIFTC